MTDANEPNQDHPLIAERRAKLEALWHEGNAYPNDFRRDSLAVQLQQQYGDRSKEELADLNLQVAIAGRLMLDRKSFKVLQDMSGRIQIYASKSVQQGTKLWDLGDIIGVRGTLCKSGKGDLYVTMDHYVLLAKALRPLPEKHHGLTDTETRYRQRYVDLMVNEKTRSIFQIRSQTIDCLRRFLAEHGFMEVETPMLQPLAGGAAARPFVTYHNTLDCELYLRIAPELYLKRLVVGGIEKVFEINRNFRNEGLSTRHNPEFTMLECYQAYADYRDLMAMTEELMRYITEHVLGTTEITYQGNSYDMTKPFVCMTMLEAILHYNADIDEAQLSDLETIRPIADRLGINYRNSDGVGKLQLEIFEKTVEDRLLQPTFITEYPVDVSPLARSNDDNPLVSDRFELFIGGREIANGFSELNDPEEQAQRLRQQVEEKAAGDVEAMCFDEDYITALEYGLPPTAGEGIGIDRLVMLLTDSPAIRDVILFPTLRAVAFPP